VNRIESLQADAYRIPLPRPVADSTHGTMETFQLVTARVADSDGASGTGYTFTVGRGATAILALLRDEFADWLSEKPAPASAGEIATLWDEAWWRLHWIGRGGAVSFALAALDIALWDLAAQRAGRPLWQHLRHSVDWLTSADSPPAVIPYAGGIDLEDPIDELLALTQHRLDSGFRAIKMKVGRPDLAEDVARVSAVRDLLGPDIPLMIDANMRWSVDDAIRAARGLEGLGLTWLEEPVAPEDWDGHARIFDETGLPLASGENLHSVAEFQQLIARGRVAYPEPDVATIGGITPWLQVARLAMDHDRPTTTHGVHDLHVHLLAAIDHASFLEVHGFGLDPFLDTSLEISGGKTVVPMTPGHGIAFDWPALADHKMSI